MKLLQSVYHTAVGTLAFLLFVTNTAFWGILILLLVPLKLVAPTENLRIKVTAAMVGFGENWISVNSAGLEFLHSIDWQVRGLEGLSAQKSYLVSANHRSWVDIVVLQKIFNRKIPFLRFFLKQQLLYVPLLGAAWWALDFPFMKRYSKEYLEKHPEKKGEDFKTIRKACERFRGQPISVLNFLEGTRFTKQKHERQGAVFKNLLQPKAGGIAFVLEAMGDQFDALVDVTIYYPDGDPSLWTLLSGRIRKVIVDVRQLPIPKSMLTGRYLEDAESRVRTQEWVRQFWQEKDQLISSWSR